MEQKIFKGWRLILAWVIANFLGVAVIGALSIILPMLKFGLTMIVSLLAIGLPIGLAQWLALRRVAPVSVLWILTISVGLYLGLKVSLIIPGIGNADDESLLSLTYAYTIIGLLIGLFQWFFLRGHFTRALVWPLGSAVGFGLGLGLVLVSDLINHSGIGSIILVVLVYAILTGFVISWLPVSPRSAESNLGNAS
jgi:hypothetical protein